MHSPLVNPTPHILPHISDPKPLKRIFQTANPLRIQHTPILPNLVHNPHEYLRLLESTNLALHLPIPHTPCTLIRLPEHAMSPSRYVFELIHNLVLEIRRPTSLLISRRDKRIRPRPRRIIHRQIAQRTLNSDRIPTDMFRIRRRSNPDTCARHGLRTRPFPMQQHRRRLINTRLPFTNRRHDNRFLLLVHRLPMPIFPSRLLAIITSHKHPGQTINAQIQQRTTRQLGIDHAMLLAKLLFDIVPEAKVGKDTGYGAEAARLDDGAYLPAQREKPCPDSFHHEPLLFPR